MNSLGLALLVFAALLVFFLLYSVITAKGASKRISITNPDGSIALVSVEVADNASTMMKGLMGRKSLGTDEGMLFVFQGEAIHSFWMLNTTIPLDAVFIGSDGSVTDIIGMDPCGFNITRCRIYTPKAKARYVLEVNKGYAQSHGIEIGKSKMGLPF